MAAGGGYCCGPPQINQRMGNTGGCLWECRQFLSTQNEQYETRRARGDFPIVNRSQMVSLSGPAQVKSMCGKHCAAFYITYFPLWIMIPLGPLGRIAFSPWANRSRVSLQSSRDHLFREVSVRLFGPLLVRTRVRFAAFSPAQTNRTKRDNEL